MQRTRIGEITAPSGVIVVVDPGVLESWQRNEIEDPCAVVVQLPGNGPYAVFAVGDDPEQWSRLEIVLAEGTADSEAWYGNVIVDFARVLLADQAATVEWSQHSADGKADYVFWGRDAEALAAAISAPDLGGGTWGWVDHPVDDARAKGMDAESKREANGWKLAGDWRPHNHHFQLLAQLREAGAGALDIAGAKVLGASTGGDGVFGVFVDFEGDRPLTLSVDFERAGESDDDAPVDDA